MVLWDTDPLGIMGSLTEPLESWAMPSLRMADIDLRLWIHMPQ